MEYSMNRKWVGCYHACPKYLETPNKEQFKKVILLLEKLLIGHRKLLICRLDLLAGGVDGHKDIERLIRTIKSDYKSDFYGYIWTRETSKDKNDHYHIVVLLNGSKYKDPVANLIRYKGIWKERTGNNSFVCYFDKTRGNEDSLGILQRGDLEKFDQVTYGLSYLCKTSQKPDSKTRNFGMTQLKSIKSKNTKNEERLAA